MGVACGWLVVGLGVALDGFGVLARTLALPNAQRRNIRIWNGTSDSLHTFSPGISLEVPW
jgi:hypothetical protein